MIKIGKTYTFEAAHHLPYHDGKCAQPHGHSYTVEIVVQGHKQYTGPKEGMVLDYADLDCCVEPFIKLLDHHDLNSGHIASLSENTTAENIAMWLFERLTRALADFYLDKAASHDNYQYMAKLYAIRVRETAKTFAEVTDD